MTDKLKTCMDCKWRLSDDDGYSNYTGEGTTFYCLKNLHPDAPFDQFYGRDMRMNFAQECLGFVSGEGTDIDVDREEPL